MPFIEAYFMHFTTCSYLINIDDAVEVLSISTCCEKYKIIKMITVSSEKKSTS